MSVHIEGNGGRRLDGYQDGHDVKSGDVGVLVDDLP